MASRSLSLNNAEAGWVLFSPKPTLDTEYWSIKLAPNAPPTSCLPPNYIDCSYAGAVLHGVAGPPPTSPPAFEYYSTVAGPSGGSPRLDMFFSDGGVISLRPGALVSGAWIHEDGSTTDWELRGYSTCGSTYGPTYAFAVSCHPGATVTGVQIVTDSSWIYSGGYTHYIDNIRYGAALITSPSNCQESDGNGDFHGQQQGNFGFDNDGCLDGDQNDVHSSNRGDGRDFQSTQINTANFDKATNSITITGLGVSSGLPVAFTFVAIETSVTTPGWGVSFAFSDGYTNAGTLTNGNVLLH